MANSIGLALWRLLVRLLSLSEHKSVFPMLSVAKSADHLGLTSLCNFAAEARVQRPWEHRLSDLMGSPPSHSMSNNGMNCYIIQARSIHRAAVALLFEELPHL
ncbi:TPA: hypothetical protein ACH3X1_008084 [Trebouxia sp. C0004]